MVPEKGMITARTRTPTCQHLSFACLDPVLEGTREATKTRSETKKHDSCDDGGHDIYGTRT